MIHLPFGSPIASYEEQAALLLAGWTANDPDSVAMFRHHHPRFLDDRVRWLPKKMSETELRAIPVEFADAQLALARWYSFRDWSWLTQWVEDSAPADSDTGRFERAVEAVISGDSAVLESLLREHPQLVRARSTIVTPHEPAQHRATLLHYVAANGVEGRRQRSPANAVQIATVLLRAGAEPDGLADMYGGQHTTMSMLVSSTPPADAGVQVPLVETLLDFGAAVDGHDSGVWTSPLMTALAFGFLGAAEALRRRGASVSTLAAAAGLGLLADSRRLLPTADGPTRHWALALAAQHGHTDIVGLLLDAGEDPNRYNPEGNHAHSTPLHQAALAGHLDAVRLLVSRGARLDIRDTIWEGTPLGWAEHGHQTATADYLRAAGAPIERPPT
jgi:ankyrin repeat protein